MMIACFLEQFLYLNSFRQLERRSKSFSLGLLFLWNNQLKKISQKAYFWVANSAPTLSSNRSFHFYSVGQKNNFSPTFVNSFGWSNNQINMREINRRKQLNLLHIYVGGYNNVSTGDAVDLWGLYPILD